MPRSPRFAIQTERRTPPSNTHAHQTYFITYPHTQKHHTTTHQQHKRNHHRYQHHQHLQHQHTHPTQHLSTHQPTLSPNTSSSTKSPRSTQTSKATQRNDTHVISKLHTNTNHDYEIYHSKNPQIYPHKHTLSTRKSITLSPSRSGCRPDCCTASPTTCPTSPHARQANHLRATQDTQAQRVKRTTTPLRHARCSRPRPPDRVSLAIQHRTARGGAGTTRRRRRVDGAARVRPRAGRAPAEVRELDCLGEREAALCTTSTPTSLFTTSSCSTSAFNLASRSPLPRALALPRHHVLFLLKDVEL